MARLEKEQKDLLYRAYLTDAMKILVENVAHINGGLVIPKRYIDVLTPDPNENMTGDDIAADIIQKAGLTVGGGAS